MSALPIVCDNCGAKYRLPESFSGDKAKCKQCGSVIDVAAQKTAAAAPAPVAPAKAAAAEKPASAREARAAARAQKEARPERPARGRRGGDAEAGAEAKDKAKDKDGGRRRSAERGERPAKKNNTMLFVGGGVGALAIIAVIVILSIGGDPPAGTETASAGAGAVSPAAAAPGPANQTPAPQVVPDAAAKAADAAAGQPKEAQPAEAPADKAATDKPAGQPAAAPAEKPSGEPKEKWESNKTANLADVFDPKTLPEAAWPAGVDDAQKTEIRGLVATVVEGGRTGIAAKPKIEKLGYYGVVGLIEGLRTLDYKSTEQQMTAWELNKLLEAMCAGMNTGFVVVEQGEDLDPRKADFNARTVIAWGTLLTKYPTKDAFDEWRKKRLERSAPK